MTLIKLREKANKEMEAYLIEVGKAIDIINKFQKRYDTIKHSRNKPFDKWA